MYCSFLWILKFYRVLKSNSTNYWKEINSKVIKYNVKTSDLGSPEAERVFCRSATTSLVSSFLSASVTGHCQRSTKLFLCSNVLRRTMWWVKLSYAPQFYLFHNSGVPLFQICLSFLLPQSWHTWLIICSHGDFPAPPSLTFSNYLGQTEPNFGYGKERKAVHPSSCEDIVLCQSWWSPFNSTVTALWTPWTFLPTVNQHLGWGLANKQSPSAATSVSVPEDISTFVKFGVTGDFPGFVPQSITAHSSMLASCCSVAQCCSANV